MEVKPSGFDVWRSLKDGIVHITPISMRGDRASYSKSIKSVYQYTPGYGYFKYTDKMATFMGNKKNKYEKLYLTNFCNTNKWVQK